jgi:hypothetical protein
LCKMIRSVKAFCLIIFIGSSMAVHAQNIHQIGINGTQFVKQFIAQNNSSLVENNPYLLTYRYHMSKFNLRGGLGGDYSFINEDNSVSQFKQETTNKAIAIRVGADITKEITKRWVIYYGLDIFHTQQSRITKTFPSSGQFVQKTIITQENRATGLGGVLTLEFRINERITLFTEANLNWSLGSASDKVENPDFPDSSTSITSKSGKVSYITPLSLFFSILI